MEKPTLQSTNSRYTPAARYPVGACHDTSRRAWHGLYGVRAGVLCSMGLLLATAMAGCVEIAQSIAILRNKQQARSKVHVDPNGFDANTPVGVEPELDSVWEDPEFRQRFADSYISETDIEPKVTLAEREQLMKVFDRIKTGKLDEAAALLERGREKGCAVYDFLLGNIYCEKAQAAKVAEAEQLEKSEKLTEPGQSDEKQKLTEAAEESSAFARQMFARSAQAYRSAIDKERKFRRAYAALGQVYVRQGRYDKALPILTKVIELGGGDGTTYGMLGYAYSSVDKPLPAESAYRMAILLDPNTLEWRLGFAAAVVKQERYPEAVALFGQLVAQHPDRADFWLYQANAYIGIGQPLKAAENLEMVDRLGKSTCESLNMLGDIYLNQESYAMAVRCYVRAVETKPSAGCDRALRAAKVLAARNALEETKRLIGRIEELQADALSDADRKELLRLRARIAVAEGAGKEEVRILEQIVKLDPLDGEALLLLGQHAARTNNKEQAVFYYERAEQLGKYEADANVRLAQLLVKDKKYAEALPKLKRAQEIKPRENVQKFLEQVERAAKGR